MNNDIVAGFDDEKADSLKIRLTKIDEVPACLVLSLKGYVDTYSSGNLIARVLKAIEAGFIRLILDLEEITYPSEVDIGCYAMFLKAVKVRGGDLVFLNLPRNVYEVWQMLGFAQFFAREENLDSAIAYLTNSVTHAAPR